MAASLSQTSGHSVEDFPAKARSGFAAADFGGLSTRGLPTGAPVPSAMEGEQSIMVEGEALAGQVISDRRPTGEPVTT